MGVYVDTNRVRGIKAPSEFSVFDSEGASQAEFSDRASRGQGELFGQRRNIYAYNRELGAELIGFSYLQGGGMDYNLRTIQLWTKKLQ